MDLSAREVAGVARRHEVADLVVGSDVVQVINDQASLCGSSGGPPNIRATPMARMSARPDAVVEDDAVSRHFSAWRAKGVSLFRYVAIARHDLLLTLPFVSARLRAELPTVRFLQQGLGDKKVDVAVVTGSLNRSRSGSSCTLFDQAPDELMIMSVPVVATMTRRFDVCWRVVIAIMVQMAHDHPVYVGKSCAPAQRRFAPVTGWVIRSDLVVEDCPASGKLTSRRCQRMTRLLQIFRHRATVPYSSRCNNLVGVG